MRRRRQSELQDAAEANAMHQIAVHLQEVETERDEYCDRVAELAELKPTLRRLIGEKVQLTASLASAETTCAHQAATIGELKRRFRAAVERQAHMEERHAQIVEDAVRSAVEAARVDWRVEASAAAAAVAAAHSVKLGRARREHTARYESELAEVRDARRASEERSTAREDGSRMLLAEAKLQLATSRFENDSKFLEFERQRVAMVEQMSFTMLQLQKAKIELADRAANRRTPRKKG